MNSKLSVIANDNASLSQKYEAEEKAHKLELRQLQAEVDADKNKALSDLKEKLSSNFNEKEKEYLDLTIRRKESDNNG